MQRGLDQHLRGRGERHRVRLEHQRQQPRAEIRPHHPLALHREQHLLDQVADVIGARRSWPCGRGRRNDRGSRVRAHAVPPQVASTRVCATTGSIGVPVGVQTDCPIMVAAGCAADHHPCRAHHHLRRDARRRRAGERAGRDRVGAGEIDRGLARRITRGNGAIGVACPAWLHNTVAPRCKTGAGMCVS